MPLVRIDIPQGWPEARIAAFADAVHDSFVETVDVPHNDRFQVIAEHAPRRLILDRTYFGVDRGPGASVVQVAFRRGRSEEKKRALYAAIEVDESIPHEHYTAVAKIIGFVMSGGRAPYTAPTTGPNLRPGAGQARPLGGGRL